MSVQALQSSFAAGELSPHLYSRVDLAKFHIGAKLLYNFFVHAHGGASNRPGSQFVGRAWKSAYPVHLIPFQFSLTQTYDLEFGHLYMRVIMNGGHVLEPAKTITGITQANPLEVTSVAHGFLDGDQVFVSGVAGMVGLNSYPGRQYLVANKTADTFNLTTLDGALLDSSTWPAFSGTASIARVYTLVTPYTGAEVATIKWAQSADTLTLCHPNHPPADLTRTQHWAWTLTTLTFAAAIGAPTNVVATPSTAGLWYGYYVVTAESDDPPAESVPSSAATCTTVLLNQTTGERCNITWSAVAGAARYRVYKAMQSKTQQSAGCSVGYIGNTEALSFTDENFGPDFSRSPPIHRNPFSGAGNYPGVVTYFQQRRVFAGSLNNPQTLWTSQPGDYTNMDVCIPVRPSDAITATIAATQINAIKQLVPVSSLLVMTNGGAWKMDGGSVGSAITPTQVVVTPQSYSGCADVAPIPINQDVIYVQDKGSIVRALAYDLYASVYTGNDMSVLSSHLFFGQQIVRWAFAEEPFKVVWAVRGDGRILFFTYLKEQNVYAWTWGDSPGDSGADRVLSVSTIPEDIGGGTIVDAVYMVVERTIPGINGGNPVKYIERAHSRNFQTAGVADVTRAWFLDCGAQRTGAGFTTVDGLDYLEGATVSILGDGNVHPPAVVTNGQITLFEPVNIVTVGLPYVSQLETLKLLPGDAHTQAQGSRTKISAVTVRVMETRGLKVGPSFNALTEIKERTRSTPYGLAVPLITGDERLVIDNRYTITGTVCFEQSNPLPCSILGVIPDVEIGDSAGTGGRES